MWYSRGNRRGKGDTRFFLIIPSACKIPKQAEMEAISIYRTKRGRAMLHLSLAVPIAALKALCCGGVSLSQWLRNFLGCLELLVKNPHRGPLKHSLQFKRNHLLMEFIYKGDSYILPKGWQTQRYVNKSKIISYCF